MKNYLILTLIILSFNSIQSKADVFFAGDGVHFIKTTYDYGMPTDSGFDKEERLKKYAGIYINFSACQALKDKMSATCEMIATVKQSEFSKMRTCEYWKATGNLGGAAVGAFIVAFALGMTDGWAGAIESWTIAAYPIFGISLFQVVNGPITTFNRVRKKIKIYSKESEKIKHYITNGLSYGSYVQILGETLERSALNCDVADYSAYVDHTEYVYLTNEGDRRRLMTAEKQ